MIIHTHDSELSAITNLYNSNVGTGILLPVTDLYSFQIKFENRIAILPKIIRALQLHINSYNIVYSNLAIIALYVLFWTKVGVNSSVLNIASDQ